MGGDVLPIATVKLEHIWDFLGLAVTRENVEGRDRAVVKKLLPVAGIELQQFPTAACEFSSIPLARGIPVVI